MGAQPLLHAAAATQPHPSQPHHPLCAAPRAQGNTRAPLRAALVASVANLVLDPGLMIWPVKLGVTGAAAATAASQIVACALLFRALRRDLFSPPAASATFAPVASAAAAASAAVPGGDDDEERAAKRRLLGTSAATLTRTTSVLGTWVYLASLVARRLGPSAIAAHGVALKARPPLGRSPTHPGCNPMHPGCSPVHPGCSLTHPGCNPMPPGCNLVPAGVDPPRPRRRGARRRRPGAVLAPHLPRQPARRAHAAAAAAPPHGVDGGGHLPLPPRPRG